MITLQGKSASGGIAFGKISFLKRSSASVEKRSITDLAAELQRFEEARNTACEQLDDLSERLADKIGAENAALFEMHRMMLQDPDYIEPITEIIKKEKVCAEYAVNTGGSRLAQDFAEMDDEYMKARSTDVYDISRRIINILAGVEDGPAEGGDPGIFAADDFTPSETAQMDRSKVLAMISKQGSYNSHSSIFARNMGIPAVIGFGEFLSADLSGKEAALDATEGVLYIEPETAVIEKLKKKQDAILLEKQEWEQFRGKPTVSKNGKKIKLYANIGSVKDAEAAVEGDAEGVGLFRSEGLYLESNDYPDEETQFETYKQVLKCMGDRPVIIRTLDIGADKQAAYFKLPKEENPAMGLRAIRICLTRPELFKTQLRAIYRASAFGNAAIMFPMINSVNDLKRAKQIATIVRTELAAKQIPFKADLPIGIMIETPASAVIADLLAKESDFFSIGTNDLTQYTLAVDRQNDSISEFCDAHHEAILRLIGMATEAAHKAGIWCGICGSLGADETLIKTFLDIGLDELSVEAPAILKLRKIISEN
ncbi:MAG: phosphoenolpyruvate--protein phosphotransferase [Spirochaetaceae bacterium]|jgi:phosphotransferase system enzyme I (PtsI)|nr:phosphoenolpyruvate--protein phosphotransferase [Spirochaetaceae bacterium]